MKWYLKNKNAIKVFDVAEYILRKMGPTTAMKLQKLVYYCQAWSLVWDEKPLFQEKIEAWANGPVVRKLFEAHRGQFVVEKFRSGNPDKLNETEKETIDAVLDYYRDKSSQWLSDLTHNEEPWKRTRGGLHEDERGHREITHDNMEEYYSSLSDE